MTVQHQQKDGKEIFFVTQAGEGKAEMVGVVRPPATLVIEHTGVDEALRGQHIGDALVEAGVAYAREHRLTVLPLCSFARKLIDRKPEWQDVIGK